MVSVAWEMMITFPFASSPRFQGVHVTAQKGKKLKTKVVDATRQLFVEK